MLDSYKQRKILFWAEAGLIIVCSSSGELTISSTHNLFVPSGCIESGPKYMRPFFSGKKKQEEEI